MKDIGLMARLLGQSIYKFINRFPTPAACKHSNRAAAAAARYSGTKETVAFARSHELNDAISS